MKITLSLNGNRLICEREQGDPRYTRGYALPESTLLYHIKQRLNAAGLDLIKKRMWKDGHMVDDLQQYIRSRKLSDFPAVLIYNDAWQVADAADLLMDRGRVSFQIVYNPDEKEGPEDDRHRQEFARIVASL